MAAEAEDDEERLLEDELMAAMDPDEEGQAAMEEKHLLETIALSEEIERLEHELRKERVALSAATKALATQLRHKQHAEARAEQAEQQLRLQAHEHAGELQALRELLERRMVEQQQAQAREATLLRADAQRLRATVASLQRQLDAASWTPEREAQLAGLPCADALLRLLRADSLAECEAIGQKLLQEEERDPAALVRQLTAAGWQDRIAR
jgi:hypothetical protein